MRVFPAPESALMRGLLVPGLGQYATGRRALGTVVLAAAGGAVFLGSRSEVATRTETATDPFGNSYEYEVEYLDRPNQALGFAAAVGIGVAAAIESYLYLRRQPRAVASGFDQPPAADRRVSVEVDASNGLRLGLRVTAARPEVAVR